MAERMIFAEPRLVTSVRIDHALAIAHEPDTGAVLSETARELASFRGVKSRWRDELASAVSLHQRPTLILWGDRDRVLPVHHLDAARHVHPAAQTHTFAGVGHMPQIECPDEFASVVLSFLASVQSSHSAGAAEEVSAGTASVSGAKPRGGSRRRAVTSA